MDYRIVYDIEKVALETINGINDVVSEIRFYHTLMSKDIIDAQGGVSNYSISRRLYVAHPKYESGEELTSDKINKQIIIELIEKTLGEGQIQIMTKLLEDDYKEHTTGFQSKRYVNVNI